MFDLDLNVPLIMTLLFWVKGNYSTVFYGVTSLKANSAKIVFAGIILNFESSFFFTVRKIYQNKDLPWSVVSRIKTESSIEKTRILA